jgi:hypothetical protein
MQSIEEKNKEHRKRLYDNIEFSITDLKSAVQEHQERYKDESDLESYMFMVAMEENICQITQKIKNKL